MLEFPATLELEDMEQSEKSNEDAYGMLVSLPSQFPQDSGWTEIKESTISQTNTLIKFIKADELHFEKNKNSKPCGLSFTYHFNGPTVF